MNRSKGALVAMCGVALSGCAGLQFNQHPKDGALTYYDSAPYLLVQTDKDCVTTATVVSIPTYKRSVSFKNGYGTADLSVSLNANGTISSINQKTDSKIPETITAVTGLIGATKPFVASANGGIPACVKARLYPIVGGIPKTKGMIDYTH